MALAYSNLYEILERGRRITEFFIDKNGEWDISYALLHIHSEVTEAYETVRNQKTREDFSEEMGDVFLTALEVCHIYGLGDKEIHNLIINALQKVEKRIKEENI